MSKFIFKPNDVFTNRIKTYPSYDLFAYSGSIYINNITNISGVNTANNTSVPDGYISLYEMNIDRSTGLIYPWIYANANKATFRKNLRYPNVQNWEGTTAATASGEETYVYPTLGTVIAGTYPLSASVTRNLTAVETITFRGDPTSDSLVLNRTGSALASTARKYTRLSKHFVFTPTGSYRSQLYSNQTNFGSGNDFLSRDLTKSDINMVLVPSIFYGSTIKKGSVSLDFYITGSSIAKATDERKNGELIGTTGATSGSVVGIVMYDEGIMLLTSSANLETGPALGIKYDGSGAILSSWMYFGASMNDGISDLTLLSASYGVNFKGTSYVNTMTMFCHAKDGQLNYSNNPTFKKNADLATYPDNSSPHNFFSEKEVGLKNIVSSSYAGIEENFQKTTYISKVGVYDDDGNLIMIANTSSPIKKTEDTDYTFKLKIDL